MYACSMYVSMYALCMYVGRYVCIKLLILFSTYATIYFQNYTKHKYTVKAKRGFEMFKYAGTMRKERSRHALSITVRQHTP